MSDGKRIGADDGQAEELAALLGSLRDHLTAVETQARTAAREAAAARAEVALLRDEVAAAERDQQDLRTMRAKLQRLSGRGLMARILNRDAAMTVAPPRKNVPPAAGKIGKR